MKKVLQKNSLGIVLDTGAPNPTEDTPPLKAHLILNRQIVDGDGHTCLTTSTGFDGILDVIDSLKSELDCLANETILWFAHSIASRRARFVVISNDEPERVGGVCRDGGGKKSIAPPSHPTMSLHLPRIVFAEQEICDAISLETSPPPSAR